MRVLVLDDDLEHVGTPPEDVLERDQPRCMTERCDVLRCHGSDDTHEPSMTGFEPWTTGSRTVDDPCEHGLVRFAAIVLLAGCFSKPPRPDGTPDTDAPGDGTQVQGWLDGFSFRKHVTVTAGATETIVNFPVGVVIEDSDLAAHAGSDGKDIVATAGDGETLLATELAVRCVH